MSRIIRIESIRGSVKQILKKFFFAIIYFFTAFGACLLAFVLVLNFLNPAISEEPDRSKSQSEKLTFKRVFGDIIKNLKNIAKDSFSDDAEPSQNEEHPTAPEAPQEVDIPKEDLKSFEDSTEPAPEDSIREQGQDNIQPSPETQPEPSPETQPDPPPETQLEPPPETQSESSSETQPDPPPEAQPEPSSETQPDPPPEAQPEPSSETQPDPPPEAQPEPSSETQPDPPPEAQPEPSPETQPDPPTEMQPDDEMDNASEVTLEIKSYMAPFIYESIKQRDPFEDPTVKKSKGVVIIPKTPPEKYDLKEIQLKGVIWDTEPPKALFKLPGDAGHYTLLKGDKVGKKGVIFDIREGEVVIVETNQLSSGDQIKEEQTVKIKKMNRIGISHK